MVVPEGLVVPEGFVVPEGSVGAVGSVGLVGSVGSVGFVVGSVGPKHFLNVNTMFISVVTESNLNIPYCNLSV